MNNISFQGHSTLILSPKLYEEASDVSKQAYRKLSSNTKCRLTNGKVFTLEADASKLAVVLRNEKDGCIKYVPTKGKVDRIISDIAGTIEDLKHKAQGKLTAWVIGGDAIESQNGNQTIKTLDKIAGVVCDRPDVDTSILVGSKMGEDRIFLHTTLGKLELGLDKNPKQIKHLNSSAEEKMENYFDIVELNNSDMKLD